MAKNPWRLKYPGKQTIREKPDEWIVAALEAHRNSLNNAGPVIGICPRALRAEMERRGLAVPVADRRRGGGILGGTTARDIEALYRANNRNLKDLAEVLGVAESTARKAMRRLGVPILKGYRRWDATAEALRAMYWDEGLTGAQIGERVGWCAHRVTAKMKELGVPRRPRNPRWSEWPTEAAHRRIENARRARWSSP